MIDITAERYFAITTDSWTSIAHYNYITCTAHFIEKKTGSCIPLFQVFSKSLSHQMQLIQWPTWNTS
jgi:hypothetical protein